MATKKKSVSKEKPATLHKKRTIDESKTLDETVTPKADVVSVNKPDCKRSDCLHPAALHYGGLPGPWCNKSGCICQEYV